MNREPHNEPFFSSKSVSHSKTTCNIQSHQHYIFMRMILYPGTNIRQSKKVNARLPADP